MNKADPTLTNSNNRKAPTWNKCKSLDIPNKAATVTLKAINLVKKAKALTHNSPANSLNDKSKSGNGSGPTPLSKVSVPAPEVAILPPFQVPLLSYLVDTILQAKLKAMLTSMIPTF
jgi:hypothetical protein